MDDMKYDITGLQDLNFALSFEGDQLMYCKLFCTTAFTAKQPWNFWQVVL
jgi:hypothetical protein